MKKDYCKKDYSNLVRSLNCGNGFFVQKVINWEMTCWPLMLFRAFTALNDIPRLELICLKIDTSALKTHSRSAIYDSAPSEHFFWEKILRFCSFHGLRQNQSYVMWKLTVNVSFLYSLPSVVFRQSSKFSLHTELWQVFVILMPNQECHLSQEELFVIEFTEVDSSNRKD